MQNQTTDQEKHFQDTGKTKTQYLQFTQSFQSSAAERQLDKMDRKRDKTTEGENQHGERLESNHIYRHTSQRRTTRQQWCQIMKRPHRHRWGNVKRRGPSENCLVISLQTTFPGWGWSLVCRVFAWHSQTLYNGPNRKASKWSLVEIYTTECHWGDKKGPAITGWAHLIQKSKISDFLSTIGRKFSKTFYIQLQSKRKTLENVMSDHVRIKQVNTRSQLLSHPQDTLYTC